MPSQWEMYDLENDPPEKTDLAWEGYPRGEAQQIRLRRLKRKLAEVRETRLAPVPALVSGADGTAALVLAPLFLSNGWSEGEKRLLQA